MGDFDLNQNQNTSELEQTLVSEQYEKTTQREMELDNIKQQQIELLKKAEDTEQKYTKSSDSIAELWNSAIQDIAKAYNSDIQTNKFKQKMYDTLQKVGIDMYQKQANKMLNSAQQKADSIKGKLDYLDDKLNNDVSNDGIAVKLKHKKEIATDTANALIQSRILLEEYTKELSQKQQEIDELKTLSQENSTRDYSKELDYINNSVTKTKEQKQEVMGDIKKLTNKLYISNAQIKTKDAIVNSIELVYKKGMSAYNDLVSGIEITREFVNEGILMDKGLGRVVTDLDGILNTTNSIYGIEENLGKTLITSTKIINDKMENIQGNSRDQSYLNEIKKQTNEDEQKLNNNIEGIISEYATIPYN